MDGSGTGEPMVSCLVAGKPPSGVPGSVVTRTERRFVAPTKAKNSFVEADKILVDIELKSANTAVKIKLLVTNGPSGSTLKNTPPKAKALGLKLVNNNPKSLLGLIVKLLPKE